MIRGKSVFYLQKKKKMIRGKLYTYTNDPFELREREGK